MPNSQQSLFIKIPKSKPELPGYIVVRKTNQNRFNWSEAAAKAKSETIEDQQASAESKAVSAI